MESPRKRPDEKASKAVVTGDAAQNNPKDGQNQSPTTAPAEKSDIPPAPTQGSNSKQGKNHPSEWRKNSIERALLIVELFGLIGLGVYCVLNYMEWSVFDSERQTMEHEFTSSQTNSQMQLEEMQRTRALDERAWVTPTQSAVVISPIGDSGSMSVQVQYKNTGKTPAIKAVCILGSSPNFGDIGKNEGYPTNSFNFAMISPEEIDHTALDSINKQTVEYIKGGNPYYVFGIIWYDDIFRKRHWTTFSYVVGTNLVVSFPTAIHNSCDDVETNQTN
jgi:hypothetical protein